MSKNYIMSARLTILMEIWSCACLFVQQYHFGGNFGVKDGMCVACGKTEEQHPRDPKGKEPRRFCYDFMYSDAEGEGEEEASDAEGEGEEEGEEY